MTDPTPTGPPPAEPPAPSTRHHKRHWRGGRPPLAWILARGMHRTLVLFLLLAAFLGAGAGIVAHLAMSTAVPATGLICLALALISTLWPLAWVASMRLAWPMQRLAAIAADMQSGGLRGREELDATGPVEVGEVAGALRGMADRVARQLKDQRALMAAVSHELRSPLGRARVLIEMAREGSAPPSFHDDLQREIDAMDDLVGDLLAAARIDFEAVMPREISSKELAERAIEVARLPPNTMTDLDDPGVVKADPTLMARALGALLDNARKYGGNVVGLSIRGRVTRVRFTVEDDGPGFAPGDEVSAFEPFWRGPTSGQRGDGATKPRGEGLGLSLVRQIANAHGGDAGAENRREGGARVWIELPRVG